MKPPKSILDQTFVYRSSVHTDIRETFKRAELEAQKQRTWLALQTKCDDPSCSYCGTTAAPSGPQEP